MKKYILILCALLATGCAANKCEQLGKSAYVPPSVPNELGISIEGTDIRADRNGGTLLSDYIKSRNQLQAIYLECNKK